MHITPHPYAGQTVTLVDGVELDGQFGGGLAVEDWNDRVFGQSWQAMQGHPAALAYAVRAAAAGLPLDNDVVYGKTPDGLGHLVHVSELAGEA